MIDSSKPSRRHVARPRRLTRRSSGVTLVEVLLAAVVIGILALIATPYFLCSLSKSRMASRLADLQSARDSVELFKAELGSFPLTLEDAYRGAPVPGHLIYCVDDDDANAGHGNEFCTFFDPGNPSDNAPQGALIGVGYLLMTQRDLCPCQDVDFVWLSCCGQEPNVVAPGEMGDPPGHPGKPKGPGEKT